MPIFLGVVAVGCANSPYHLPAPPAQDDQRNVAADPAEQAEEDRQRYLQARASLLELYELLSDERFSDAEQLLSQQTRDFLAHGEQTPNAATALSQGRLVLSDGRSVEFEPVEFLLGGDVRQIQDTVEGVEEHETQGRRELFVIDAEGEPHKVVMIREGNQWVLHRTAVSPGQE